MKITRRTFLKISGATAAGTVMGGLGFDLSPAEVYAQELRIKGAKETTTVCCFCSVGCGIIVSTDAKGKVINSEGDPDHPISEGSLCAKGSSLYQIAVNDNRLKKVRYRAPYSNAWKEVSWEWALDKIAANTKRAGMRALWRRMLKDKWSTEPMALLQWEAQRWIMKNAGSTQNSSDHSASFTLNIRPVSDTAPL